MIDAIATDGSTAYMVHSGGNLVALDVRSGRRLWATGVVAGVGYWPTPMPDSTTLFLSGWNGFYALHK